MIPLKQYKLFDSHFHIIDPAFPLVENQGFLPDFFTCGEYLKRLENYNLAGGAIVSGSFQGFDQEYLKAALEILGPAYVGVTQLPFDTTDSEILTLDRAGVRGVRLNLKRGVARDLNQLENFARRIHELADWHIDLYIDFDQLSLLSPRIQTLPRISIAHLGLSEKSLPLLLKLVEKNVYVKASRFGCLDFNVAPVMRQLADANPAALLFGTDLPSTRSLNPYSDSDFQLIIDVLGEDLAERVFYRNAVEFYHPAKTV